MYAHLDAGHEKNKFAFVNDKDYEIERPNRCI